MDAGAVDSFLALVQNADGAPSGATVDYARVDLMDHLASVAFNALLITWVDPHGRALSSTPWPTTLDGLTVTELRFNGFRGQTGSITLYGDNPAPVVPEPGTISLLAGGLLAAYSSRRRATAAAGCVTP